MAWRAAMILLAASFIVQIARGQDAQLFSQAASADLEHHFNRSELSWLLLDSSGRLLAQHWDSVETPVSPGSLVKPFLALAYGQQHDFTYLRHHCDGTKSRCWLPRGHGWLGIEAAIGQSCNSYFLALADGIDRSRAEQTFAALGLHGPPPEAPNDALIGLGSDWKERPLVLARAYLTLMHGGSEEVITRGMAMAAETGTAQQVDAILGSKAAFAKTGTAVCSHHPRGAADGFTVVLYPSGQPRLLLLVRMHGATGAQTSAVAGQMMRAIGQGLR